eukprot:Em0001g725a
MYIVGVWYGHWDWELARGASKTSSDSGVLVTPLRTAGSGDLPTATSPSNYPKDKTCERKRCMEELEPAKKIKRQLATFDICKRSWATRMEEMTQLQRQLRNLRKRAVEETQSDTERKELRTKVEGYLRRAETLKELIKAKEEPSEKVHCIQIRAGDRGYGYETLFRDCLDDNVEWVELDDPYIRARHQVRNFVQFCELMVKRCKRLRQITLTTELIAHLQGEMFSNGWIVKIGRGLDYFQRPAGQSVIGCYDYDLRPCHETTVEKYHKLNMTAKTHT